MLRSKVVIWVLFFLFLVSCDKLNSRKSLILDYNFRSYFSFNNFSEWSYHQIKDTFETEKVVLSGFLEGKMRNDGVEQDFFEFRLNSDKDSQILMRAVADEGNVGRAVALVKDTFYRLGAQWYYVAGQFSGISGLGDTTIFHDTYSQLGKTYSNVIELVPKKSRYFKRIFISKGIGIIRKELTNGKVFVLKSYEIK